MVLITLSDIVILFELLIGFVIIGTDKLTVELSFNAKMVIGCSGEHTPSVSWFNNALCKGNRGRNAIPAHLFHCVFRVLFDIRLSWFCHFLTFLKGYRWKPCAWSSFGWVFCPFSMEAPGVTISLIPRFAVCFGASIWSQIATRCPARMSLGK